MSDCVPRNFIHTSDPEQKDEILEWCRQNYMTVECLGVFLHPATWKGQLRWLVVDDKQKTMFNLKWSKQNDTT